MWSSNGEVGSLTFHVGSYLKTLSLSMDLILDFGNGLMEDLLALHRTVSFQLIPSDGLIPLSLSLSPP